MLHDAWRVGVAGGGDGRSGSLDDRHARPVTSLIDSPVFDAILYGDAFLENGTRSYAAKVVQTALQRCGFNLRGGADGHFGPATRNQLMRFQRDQGLIPNGILDREALLALDRRLAELDKGRRTEALPAPRPLRGLADAYLEDDEERALYQRIVSGLRELRDRRTTAPEADVDDLEALLDVLDVQPPSRYASLLRALAATRETNQWAPTLLDLLLVLPASLTEEPSLRERLCDQILRKLGGEAGGAVNILTHASSDSIGRLSGAPSFKKLLSVLR